MQLWRRRQTEIVVGLVALAALAGVYFLAESRPPASQEACPPACPTPTTVPAPTGASPTLPPLVPSQTPTPTARPPTATPFIPASRLPILEYHDTQFNMANGQVSMTTTWFLEQMQWLQDNGFVTLTADQLLGHLDGSYDPPQRSVVLTFDIGQPHADNYQDVIIPALRQHGFHALFFVVTNFITEDGANNSVTWSMLRQWRDEGLIAVQSHGVYHPDYTLISFGEMLWDARTAYDLIAQQMGEAPMIFAYPFDAAPDNPQLVMQRAGYQAAMSGHRNDRSVHRQDPDRYALPRYYPYADPDLYPILVGAEGWTFPEMMLQAIAEPAAAPSPTASGAPGNSGAPFSYLEDYVNYCRFTGGRDDLEVEIGAAFSTDISRFAQGQLTAPLRVRPTCEHGDPIVPEAIVLHFTGGEYEASVQSFHSDASGASAHYIVDRDGTITQMVPEFYGAYHVTCYGIRAACLPDCPICDDAQGRLIEPWRRSIGIEIVNIGPVRGRPGDFQDRNGRPFEGLVFTDYLASWRYRYWEDYPEAQIAALRVLVLDIMQRWNIPLERVIGHSRIQPEKIDPGPALNLTWRRYGDPPRDPIFLLDAPGPLPLYYPLPTPAAERLDLPD
ncbi:MAG: N-acetylmuramoyl-L-alanine amidase [Chloroflexota bacterium]